MKFKKTSSFNTFVTWCDVVLKSNVNPEIQSELGKKTSYESIYNPQKLYAIPRAIKRHEIGIEADLPFYGMDHWNHYEISWLNLKGKPMVAMGQVIFDACSPYLIESKSMKLYFNSLNNTKFSDVSEVINIVTKDLEEQVQSKVRVNIMPIQAATKKTVPVSIDGHCLDDLDIECNRYSVDPTLLETEAEETDEILFTHLLRSNCLVTGQPDWGSVKIAYQGKKIDHASLLKYIVSFRNHTEFGEHCVERIFMDLMRQCKPARLLVVGQFTRRGGIDINCFRSSHDDPENWIFHYLCRQ